MNAQTRTTAEIAQLIGVSKDTLLRWLRQGLIREPKRDRRGWRFFSSAEAKAIQKYANSRGTSAGFVKESSASYGTTTDVVEPSGTSRTDLDYVSFNVHVLSGIYRRAHDLMRNIDGLHPQEAFDELLKYLSLKETLEKQGINLTSPFVLTAYDDLSALQAEEASRLHALFAEYFKKMGRAAAELWKEARFRLSDKCLIGLHNLFQPLQFSSIPFDLRSAALREFLAPQTRKALGIFLTPDDVARMMVDVVSPRLDGRICDPACGTGTFLIEVLKHWQRRRHKNNDVKPVNFTVFGIDKNPRMLLLADLNLHHAQRCVFRSQLADSLAEGTIKPNTCDAIFTNPPFGVNVDDKAIDLSVYQSAKGLILCGSRRVPSEILFLELCLKSLSPGGMLAIVLPRSVATNGSLDGARRVFNNMGHVSAIVSLPPETFQATGTQTTTIVLFVKKYEQKEDRDEKVRICIANVLNVGYDATGRKREGSQLSDVPRHIHECTELQKDVSICSLTPAVPKGETFSRLPELLANRVSRHKTIRLGDVLTLAVCGRTPPRASYTPAGLFVVKVGNLTGNGIDWTPRDRNFVDPNTYHPNGANGDRYLQKNDILLTAAAHSPVYIAKKVDIVTAIPLEVGGKASYVGEVMLLRPDPEKVDPFVLLAYLRLPSVRMNIQMLIRGQTAHLYPDDVLNLTVEAAVRHPGQALKTLSELARLEAESFEELNRIMFSQRKIAAALDD